MTPTLKTTLLLLLVMTVRFASAQSAADRAHALVDSAFTLEDDSGKVDEAIKLLEQAQKIVPDAINYTYEYGYAYYNKKDYKKAIKYLEEALKMKGDDSKEKDYELLGNAYDNLGKSDKATEVYETGLQKVPNSGRLRLELGIMQLEKKDYDKALGYFEKGIEVAPKFPSNYYWAAKIYCNSFERVWGMIYGEIFMNLERGSKRTDEISKLLYLTYKDAIKFTNDTSISVDFTKTVTDTNATKLPFAPGVYEPLVATSLDYGYKFVDLKSLNDMRKKFVENYYKQELDKKYPNILFAYQQKMMKLGYLEAYNYWLLSEGNLDDFEKWRASNKDQWDGFIKWFTDNPMQVDGESRFYSGQY